MGKRKEAIRQNGEEAKEALAKEHEREQVQWKDYDKHVLDTREHLEHCLQSLNQTLLDLQREHQQRTADHPQFVETRKEKVESTRERLNELQKRMNEALASCTTGDCAALQSLFSLSTTETAPFWFTRPLKLAMHHQQKEVAARLLTQAPAGIAVHLKAYQAALLRVATQWKAHNVKEAQPLLNAHIQMSPTLTQGDEKLMQDGASMQTHLPTLQGVRLEYLGLFKKNFQDLRSDFEVIQNQQLDIAKDLEGQRVQVQSFQGSLNPFAHRRDLGPHSFHTHPIPLSLKDKFSSLNIPPEFYWAELLGLGKLDFTYEVTGSGKRHSKHSGILSDGNPITFFIQAHFTGKDGAKREILNAEYIQHQVPPGIVADVWTLMTGGTPHLYQTRGWSCPPISYWNGVLSNDALMLSSWKTSTLKSLNSNLSPEYLNQLKTTIEARVTALQNKQPLLESLMSDLKKEHHQMLHLCHLYDLNPKELLGTVWSDEELKGLDDVEVLRKAAESIPELPESQTKIEQLLTCPLPKALSKEELKHFKKGCEDILKTLQSAQEKGFQAYTKQVQKEIKEEADAIDALPSHIEKLKTYLQEEAPKLRLQTEQELEQLKEQLLQLDRTIWGEINQYYQHRHDEINHDYNRARRKAVKSLAIAVAGSALGAQIAGSLIQFFQIKNAVAIGAIKGACIGATQSTLRGDFKHLVKNTLKGGGLGALTGIAGTLIPDNGYHDLMSQVLKTTLVNIDKKPKEIIEAIGMNAVGSLFLQAMDLQPDTLRGEITQQAVVSTLTHAKDKESIKDIFTGVCEDVGAMAVGSAVGHALGDLLPLDSIDKVLPTKTSQLLQGAITGGIHGALEGDIIQAAASCAESNLTAALRAPIETPSKPENSVNQDALKEETLRLLGNDESQVDATLLNQVLEQGLQENPTPFHQRALAEALYADDLQFKMYVDLNLQNEAASSDLEVARLQPAAAAVIPLASRLGVMALAWLGVLRYREERLEATERNSQRLDTTRTSEVARFVLSESLGIPMSMMPRLSPKEGGFGIQEADNASTSLPIESQEPTSLETPVVKNGPTQVTTPLPETKPTVLSGPVTEPKGIFLLFKKPGSSEERPHAPDRDKQFHKAPSKLPAFDDAERADNKSHRKRWKLPDGKILEWDGQHGEVEMYNKRGKHLGAFDPVIRGKRLKEAVPGRTIEP